MIFCVLDTETTGLKPGYHEVIQVAAILCDSQLEEFARTSFKIKPRAIELASPKALEVNGYDERTWKPRFLRHKAALNHLNKFIRSYVSDTDTVVMVGQNTQFDYNFMKSEYETFGIEFPFYSTVVDLRDVAKIWSTLNGNRLTQFSLKNLAEFTNIVNDNPHDAEADAEVTLRVLKWFINDLKKVNKHGRKRIRKKTSIKV